jgi:hypothetical protein
MFQDSLTKAWKREDGYNKSIDRLAKEEVELDEATPYYKKPSFINKMSSMAKRERLERERKEKEQQKLKSASDTKEEVTPPFTPDKPKKNPPATAGKYGQGPSTAKHLAKTAMNKQTKPVKEEVELDEVAAWQRKEGKNPEGGLNQKGVESYRRENPGSKLQTAVTTKPSKLDPDSKSAKRRKSFCARMGGMKKRLTSAKTANDPDSRINKALRKWNC